MAVEVESAGQLEEALRVLRKRVWWIVVPLVVIGSLGTFYAVVVPKKYVSKAEIMVDDYAAQGGGGAAAADKEGPLAVYKINSPARISSVLDKINWPDYNQLGRTDKREYVEDVRSSLRVLTPTMPKGVQEQLVELAYRDSSPDRAHQFLVRVMNEWIDVVLKSQLQTAEDELTKVQDELKAREAESMRISNEMKEIEREYEIPPLSAMNMNGRGGGPQPQVFDDLGRLTETVAELESDISKLQAEITQKTLQRDELPARIPRDDAAPIQDPTQRQIRDIEKQIRTRRDLIAEKGWASTHSDHIRVTAEIELLTERRERLRAERRGTDGFDPVDTVSNPRRDALSQALIGLESAFEQKTGRLRVIREELREVKDRAERTGEAMNDLQVKQETRTSLSMLKQDLKARESRLRIEVERLRGPNGSPFEIRLNPTQPTKPTAPNPWIIAIGSIIVGLGLGLGLALLKEYSKNCFRSARDLSRVMTHPVLGKVNEIRTRRERARALLVQMVIGGGSLLFALSVGYITWAYAMNRDGLTDSLLDAIDNFHEMLK